MINAFRSVDQDFAPGDNVIFDTPPALVLGNITYDFATGEFTLGDAGVYEVSYGLRIDEIATVDSYPFAVFVNDVLVPQSAYQFRLVTAPDGPEVMETISFLININAGDVLHIEYLGLQFGGAAAIIALPPPPIDKSAYIVIKRVA